MKGAQMEFFVRFESSTDNALNVVKSLKQSSAIVEVGMLPENTSTEDGKYL